jgi:hypothetical protein
VTGAVEPTGIDGAPRTATYTVTPPGGSWNAADNGTYTIGMRGKEVGDDGAPQLFVAADSTLTTFNVNATNIPPVVSGVLAEDVIFPDFGETSYAFTIEYSDVAGIDVSSIDASDVTVTGPSGPLVVTGASVDIGSDGSPRTATYAVTPPGGSWDITDAGTYTIGVAKNEVLDVLGAAVASNPALITFDVLPDKLLNERFETDGQGVRYTASQPFNAGADGYWDRGRNADFGPWNLRVSILRVTISWISSVFLRPHNNSWVMGFLTMPARANTSKCSIKSTEEAFKTAYGSRPTPMHTWPWIPTSTAQGTERN